MTTATYFLHTHIGLGLFDYFLCFLLTNLNFLQFFSVSFFQIYIDWLWCVELACYGSIWLYWHLLETGNRSARLYFVCRFVLWFVSTGCWKCLEQPLYLLSGCRQNIETYLLTTFFGLLIYVFLYLISTGISSKIPIIVYNF